MQEEIILDEIQPSKRRRSLLPWWMKGFIWLLFFTTLIVLIAIYNALTGDNYDLSMYGLEASTLFSDTGILVTALYLLKFASAFGLWTEQDWAITVAITDGVAGIVICLFTMFMLPVLGNYGFSFRIELILSVIYLQHILRIKKSWLRNN